MRHDREIKAFTLIEVLVALTIIGLLLTFVAPYVFDRPDQARKLKVQNDFLAITTALNLYKLDNGIYPEADVAIDILAKQNKSGASYLQKIPIDPWNTPYRIVQVSGRDALQVVSAGADMEFSSSQDSDDITSDVVE